MMDCRSCKYHENVPGDTHVCCKHPNTKTYDGQILMEMMLIAASGISYGELPLRMTRLGLSVDLWGVSHGWVFFPMNFDPIWVSGCQGHTPQPTQATT